MWAVVGVFGQPTLSRLASPFPAWARMGLSAGPACSTTKKNESVQAGQGESGGWQWKRRAHGALLVRGARAIPRAMPLGWWALFFSGVQWACGLVRVARLPVFASAYAYLLCRVGAWGLSLSQCFHGSPVAVALDSRHHAFGPLPFRAH